MKPAASAAASTFSTSTPSASASKPTANADAAGFLAGRCRNQFAAERQLLKGIGIGADRAGDDQRLLLVVETSRKGRRSAWRVLSEYSLQFAALRELAKIGDRRFFR